LSSDYLDYFELAAGNLGLAMGDVAGKGVSGLLLTSTLRSLVRAHTHEQNASLTSWAGAVDETFYLLCPDDAYATMFLARFDPARSELHYVNAGHEPPVILRKNGRGFRPMELDPTGPVIGMLRKPTFREHVAPLLPGDLVVAYTDGLCETVNSRGEEWGFRRLLAAIQESSYRKTRDIVDRVLDAVETFAAGSQRFDDATLWIGRVEGTRLETLTDEIALAAAA
jgi:sigma-B regulation protein RsbU (phosphoserine phosphatase)